MSQPPAQETYVFDRSQTDQERLLGIARAQADFAREACLRAGLKPGDRAIDVGCGPVGALLALAELVGPAGAVVWLDASAEALTQARPILDRRGLNSVRLIQADINATDLEAVPPDAPFDVAFCRLVLTHQVEPAATLRRIAALLRPGGRIVAQDILEDPRYPSFDPPVPAVERILALQYEHKRRRGVFPDVARHYRTLCGEAGLGLVSQRGLFTVPPDPRGPLSSMRALLSSTRRGLVEYGLATDDEIEALLQEVDRASATELHFGTSSLLVEMIAEVA